jgi:SEL1 protein
MHGHGPLVDDDVDAAAVAAADRAGVAAGEGGDREIWNAVDGDGRAQHLTDEELWDEALGGVLESAVILVLAFSLAALVLYRRQRADGQRNREDERRRRERERAAEAAGGGGAAADGEAMREGDEERDRGMFPRMGDPAFMDWAVGGVGH